MKNIYKAIIAISICSFLGGCGYSSNGNKAIGQVKRVETKTPIICSDYKTADISLGVMQHGVGSMSTQDEWFYIIHNSDYELLKQASLNGELVDFTYKTARVNFCVNNKEITSVKIIPNK